VKFEAETRADSVGTDNLRFVLMLSGPLELPR
jgi:hypothetical protein